MDAGAYRRHGEADQVVGTDRLEPRLEAGTAADLVPEVTHRDLLTSSDVDHQTAAPLPRAYQGIDDIVDEDEVPSLAAITLNDWCAAGFMGRNE